MTRPDIFTVRPPGEAAEDSEKAVRDELEAAGLTVARVEAGVTQPDGSTVWYAYLKEEETIEDLIKDSNFGFS